MAATASAALRLASAAFHRRGRSRGTHVRLYRTDHRKGGRSTTNHPGSASLRRRRDLPGSREWTGQARRVAFARRERSLLMCDAKPTLDEPDGPLRGCVAVQSAQGFAGALPRKRRPLTSDATIRRACAILPAQPVAAESLLTTRARLSELPAHVRQSMYGASAACPALAEP